MEVREALRDVEAVQARKALRDVLVVKAPRRMSMPTRKCVTVQFESIQK